MNRSRKTMSRATRTKLRQRAEVRLAGGPEAGSETAAYDPVRLVHELRVHQIELEIQNEELLAARDEAEAALERYRLLFQFAPIGYFVLSVEGIVLEANGAGERLLGVPRWALVGRRMAQFVAEDRRGDFADFLLSALMGPGESESCDFLLQGGRRRHARLVGSPLDRQPPTLLVSVEDITARKDAEEELREEARRKDELIAALRTLGAEVKEKREQLLGDLDRADEKDPQRP